MNNRSDMAGYLTRFTIVGFSNFAISYLIFILLYNHVLTNSAFLSQMLSYAAGTVWSYHWNKRWTFGRKEGSAPVFLAFVALQSAMMLLSSVLIGFAVDKFAYNPSLSWFVVSGFVTVINFVLSKRILLKEPYESD